MGEATVKLERLKLWSQILATIAVPIVIVVIGNQVQQSIAEREVSKSYVQMAIEILKAPPTKETTELRQWAVATVDRLSPIPLSKKAQEQLENGEAGFQASTSSMVKYVECEVTKDKDVAKWLLKHMPNEFKKCPKDDEIGVFRYKFKPIGEVLQSGESRITLQPVNGDFGKDLENYVSSIECSQVKDEETAKWLMKRYQNKFYECPKENEVGISVLKKATD
jgi:hypothetical protein